MEARINFLRVDKGSLLFGRGRKVTLKGVNFGGWLMMEGYILGGINIAEKEFKKHLRAKLGKNAIEEFSKLFRNNFIIEEDFKNVSDLGFNCIRIPFNSRLLEGDARPYKYRQDGIGYLDCVRDFCKKYKLYYILDMHAAPGCQNADWHSDSCGEVKLWENKTYQKRCLRLWEFIADRYKDEIYLAGYDVLNESVNNNTYPILALYRDIVKSIRCIDKNHVIFIEGNKWGQEFDFLRGRITDDNFVYSVHFYSPLDFTFNFRRNLRFPGIIDNQYWSKSTLQNILSKYRRISKEDGVPIHVGEFGQNSRCPHCHNEYKWLKDTLEILEDFGFHWTYWTYKAVAAAVFPDGLYQYQDNPAWVNRQGPVFGWENYPQLWNKNKQDIVTSWRTKSFTKNKELVGLLASFIK